MTAPDPTAPAARPGAAAESTAVLGVCDEWFRGTHGLYPHRESADCVRFRPICAHRAPTPHAEVLCLLAPGHQRPHESECQVWTTDYSFYAMKGGWQPSKDSPPVQRTDLPCDYCGRTGQPVVAKNAGGCLWWSCRDRADCDRASADVARPGAGGGAAETERMDRIRGAVRIAVREQPASRVAADMAWLVSEVDRLRALAAPPAPAPYPDTSDASYVEWLGVAGGCEPAAAPAGEAETVDVRSPLAVYVRALVEPGEARDRLLPELDRYGEPQDARIRVGDVILGLVAELDRRARCRAPDAPGAADARAREDAARFEGEDDEYEADKYDDGEDDGEDTAARRAAGEVGS